MFGGFDPKSGYATRISVVAGNGTVGAPNPAGQQPPAALPNLPVLPGADNLSGALQFLLNTPSPAPGSNP